MKKIKRCTRCLLIVLVALHLSGDSSPPRVAGPAALGTGKCDYRIASWAARRDKITYTLRVECSLSS